MARRDACAGGTASGSHLSRKGAARAAGELHARTMSQDASSMGLPARSSGAKWVRRRGAGAWRYQGLTGGAGGASSDLRSLAPRRAQACRFYCCWHVGQRRCGTHRSPWSQCGPAPPSFRGSAAGKAAVLRRARPCGHGQLAHRCPQAYILHQSGPKCTRLALPGGLAR
jgi:hypothetical protein